MGASANVNDQIEKSATLQVRQRVSCMPERSAAREDEGADEDAPLRVDRKQVGQRRLSAELGVGLVRLDAVAVAAVARPARARRRRRRGRAGLLARRVADVGDVLALERLVENERVELDADAGRQERVADCERAKEGANRAGEEEEEEGEGRDGEGGRRE